jgi:hypothetical protein
VRPAAPVSGPEAGEDVAGQDAWGLDRMFSSERLLAVAVALMATLAGAAFVGSLITAFAPA